MSAVQQCVHCRTRPATLQCHTCPVGPDSTGAHFNSATLLPGIARLLCLPCDRIAHRPRDRRLHVRVPWPSDSITSASPLECCSWCDEPASAYFRLRWECAECGVPADATKRDSRAPFGGLTLTATAGMNAAWLLHDECHRYLHSADSNSQHLPRERPTVEERAISDAALELESLQTKIERREATLPKEQSVAVSRGASVASLLPLSPPPASPSNDRPGPLSSPSTSVTCGPLSLSPGPPSLSSPLTPTPTSTSADSNSSLVLNTPQRPSAPLAHVEKGILSLPPAPRPLNAHQTAPPSMRHRRAISTPIAPALPLVGPLTPSTFDSHSSGSGILSLSAVASALPLALSDRSKSSGTLALTPAAVRRTQSNDRVAATPLTLSLSNHSGQLSMSEMMDAVVTLPCGVRSRVPFGPHTSISEFGRRVYSAECEAHSQAALTGTPMLTLPEPDAAAFARRLRICFGRTNARLREPQLTMGEYGVVHRTELVASLATIKPLDFSRSVLRCTNDVCGIAVDSQRHIIFVCTQNLIYCQSMDAEDSSDMSMDHEPARTLWTVGRRQINSLDKIQSIALIECHSIFGHNVLLVANGGTHEVLALHAQTGELISAFGQAVLRDPCAIAVGMLVPDDNVPEDAGRSSLHVSIWVTDVAARSVFCFDTTLTRTDAVVRLSCEHNVSRSLGRDRHSSRRRLLNPVAVVCAPRRGCVMVADAGADRVQVYSDLNGAWIGCIGGEDDSQRTTDQIHLFTPIALCLDTSGDALYVACEAGDDETGRVSVYDATTLALLGHLQTNTELNVDSDESEDELHERNRLLRTSTKSAASALSSHRSVLRAPVALQFDQRAREVFVADPMLKAVNVFHALRE